MNQTAGPMGWAADEIKLLGMKPDEEVAALLRRSVEAVKLKRLKLGIPAPLQPPWTEEEIRLLGTRPDREVARLVDRSVSAVQLKRMKLGIPNWRAATVKPKELIPAHKVKLLYGPYYPPRTRRGHHLFCELRGTVKVGGYSDGPIPWPVKWRTRSLILCGDLVRAVREESSLAVAHHWGVCCTIVSRWRRALEVGPITAGTAHLKSVVQSEAMTPVIRAHLSRVKTGKPVNMSRSGRARVLAALRRPRSPEWHRKMARHFAARRGKPVDPRDRVWTAAEEALLGTQSDRQVAKLLKRTVEAVMARRHLKRIPSPNPLYRLWRDSEIQLLGKLSDEDAARRTKRSIPSVAAKRQTLRILLRPRAKPWTPAAEGFLGRKPDTEVAALLGRGRAAVRRRRIALKIKPAVERSPHRGWTPQEDRLLGTASDGAIARKLGRSRFSVQLRRLRLGLASHRETNRRSGPVIRSS